MVQEAGDGSIQYAENATKKYQDIYPLDFECDDWRALLAELKSVVDYWIRATRARVPGGQPAYQGATFWEWLIGEVQGGTPESSSWARHSPGRN